MYDTVSDSVECFDRAENVGIAQHPEEQREGLMVILYRGVVGEFAAPAPQLPVPFRLSDTLYENGGDTLPADEVLTLDRRASGVEDKDIHCSAPLFSLCCAWIAVMATVLTISSTRQPRLRSLTGSRSP